MPIYTAGTLTTSGLCGEGEEGENNKESAPADCEKLVKKTVDEIHPRDCNYEWRLTKELKQFQRINV